MKVYFCLMLRLLAAGAALFALSACTTGGVGMPNSPAWFLTATKEQQAAYYNKQCQTYGFSPGTPAMAQCVQNESLSGRSRASARSSVAFAAMANSGPKTTTCNRFGNTVNCTTF